MKKVFLCGYSHRTRFGKQYVWSSKRYDTLAEAMRALADCYEQNRLDPERHHPEFRYELIQNIEESEA